MALSSFSQLGPILFYSKSGMETIARDCSLIASRSRTKRCRSEFRRSWMSSMVRILPKDGRLSTMRAGRRRSVLPMGSTRLETTWRAEGMRGCAARLAGLEASLPTPGSSFSTSRDPIPTSNSVFSADSSWRLSTTVSMISACSPEKLVGTLQGFRRLV